MISEDSHKKLISIAKPKISIAARNFLRKMVKDAEKKPALIKQKQFDEYLKDYKSKLLSAYLKVLARKTGARLQYLYELVKNEITYKSAYEQGRHLAVGSIDAKALLLHHLLRLGVKLDEWHADCRQQWINQVDQLAAERVQRENTSVSQNGQHNEENQENYTTYASNLLEVLLEDSPPTNPLAANSPDVHDETESLLKHSQSSSVSLTKQGRSSSSGAKIISTSEPPCDKEEIVYPIFSSRPKPCNSLYEIETKKIVVDLFREPHPSAEFPIWQEFVIDFTKSIAEGINYGKSISFAAEAYDKIMGFTTEASKHQSRLYQGWPQTWCLKYGRKPSRSFFECSTERTALISAVRSIHSTATKTSRSFSVSHDEHEVWNEYNLKALLIRCYFIAQNNSDSVHFINTMIHAWNNMKGWSGDGVWKDFLSFEDDLTKYLEEKVKHDAAVAKAQQNTSNTKLASGEQVQDTDINHDQASVANSFRM